MAQLKPYEVIYGDLPHTLLLDEEDAKRLGARAKPASSAGEKARTPQNKAATPETKA